MKLLAIDTSTEACSAAIYINGDILSKYEIAPRKHAELILPMIDQLLAEADIKLSGLDYLAFGRGPGAFTGIRIATGVIQGLAFATDLPVVAVSSLAALAQGAISKAELLLSAIDARMGEIYWGQFKATNNNLVIPVGEEMVSKPEDIYVSENTSCFGIGSGWKTYQTILQAQLKERLVGFDSERYPHAKDIIPLAIEDYNEGKAVSAKDALPVYLRNRVTG